MSDQTRLLSQLSTENKAEKMKIEKKEKMRKLIEIVPTKQAGQRNVSSSRSERVVIH